MSLLYDCIVLGMEIIAERQEKIISNGNFTHTIHFSQAEQSPAETLDSNTKRSHDAPCNYRFISPTVAAARAYNAHPTRAHSSNYPSAPAPPAPRAVPARCVSQGVASGSPRSSHTRLPTAAPPLSPLSTSSAVGTAALYTPPVISQAVFRRRGLRRGRRSCSSIC